MEDSKSHFHHVYLLQGYEGRMNGNGWKCGQKLRSWQAKLRSANKTDHLDGFQIKITHVTECVWLSQCPLTMLGLEQLNMHVFRRNPIQTEGKHACSIQKSLQSDGDSNLGPSYYETIVLSTNPLCHTSYNNNYHTESPKHETHTQKNSL